MDLTLYQLRTFQEVARTGSLTKSARNLGYSQSSVTAHIRSLESRVGVALLQRLPHGVRLTAAGEVFQGYVMRIFDVVDEMSSTLRPKGEARGRVVVGAAGLLIDQQVGHLVRECHYRYPQVRVSPRVVGSAEVEAGVLSGELHLGLALVGSEDKVPSGQGIASQILAPVELVPVGGPELREAADRAQALRSTRVLIVDPGCASQDFLLGTLQECYGISAPVVETGSAGVARDLVRRGYGIAMLPEATVRQAGADSGLVVLPELPRARMYVRAVWSEQAWMSPALTAILELARRAGTDELAAA